MAHRPSRIAGVVVGCLALAAIVAPSAQAQFATTAGDARAPIEGSTPDWATAQARVAAADPQQRREIQVALSLRDPAGAQKLARAVSTPESSRYGQYLSAEAFTARFAATEKTVRKVSSWLREQGLEVGEVSDNRRYIEATAEIGLLQRAFNTTLSTYRHTVDGEPLRLLAPDQAVSVPRELRGAISGVLGLDDSEQTMTPHHILGTVAGPAPADAPSTAEEQFCARYWGETNNTEVPQKYGQGQQSNRLCGYNYEQMRSMYGLTGENTGAGSTVAIVGAYNAPTVVADANRAADNMGALPLSPEQYSAVLPPQFTNHDRCAPETWLAEQALDVQATHTMAPKANLIYYGAESCFGLFEALNKAVSDNRASIISNSWGIPGETDIPAALRTQMNDIAVQAAIQGQAVLFSTGDAGDNSAPAGTPEPGFPAVHPWVTAVGGTSVALEADGSTRFTTGWENAGNTQNGDRWAPQQDKDGPFAGGAGGGVSTIYAAPSYQDGVVPGSLSQGQRTIPDIAALADAYTGQRIGMTVAGEGYVESVSGGTSLASPLLAGLVANAQQAQAVDRFGFLNGALYSLAGSSALADVTPVEAGVWTPGMVGYGHVSVPSGQGSYLIDFDTSPQTLQSAPGWDPVTGTGTPAAGFISQLGQ